MYHVFFANKTDVEIVYSTEDKADANKHCDILRSECRSKDPDGAILGCFVKSDEEIEHERAVKERQTKATDKWQKKAGYVAKTFKLKADLVEAFKDKCDTAGESQAAVISKFMNNYINQ